MNAGREITKQALFLVVARGLSFVVTFAVPLILVRNLTQEDFGAYKQSLLLSATAIGLLSWGMSQSLYYFIPKEPENRAGYLANTFLFLFCMGFLSLVGFCLGAPLLGRYFHSLVLVSNAPLIGLYTFFMIATIFTEISLISDNRARIAAGIILLTEIIRAIALISGALLYRSFTGIIIALAVTAGIRFLLLGAYFYRDLKLVLNGPNLPLLRKQWQYAMPFGFMVLIGTIHDFFHQFYISYSFTPAEFAIYAVGCLQLPLNDLLYSSIGEVAMVKMAERLRENDMEGLRSFWHAASLKLAVIFIPFTTYLAVVSREFIIALFTESYRASVPIFLITLLGALSAVLIIDGVLRVFGETTFMLKAMLFRLPPTIILVMISLAMLGMVGAAASTMLIMLVVRFVMLVRIGRLMGTPLKRLLPWREYSMIGTVALCAALPVFLITLLPLVPKAVLMISAPVYGITYLLFGLYLNIFTDEERQMVRSALEKILRFGKVAIINHRDTEIS